MLVGEQLVETTLERPPLFIGGNTHMTYLVNENVTYPVDAMVNGISGTVDVTFNIDEYGRTSDFRITKRLGYGCDEEALRVVRLFSNCWLPAIYNGQAVRIEYVQTINYKIH